jgi:hypothetical protein
MSFGPPGCWADLMERHGRMTPAEARRWKDGVYGLMELWGLEPDEVLAPSYETALAWTRSESHPLP